MALAWGRAFHLDTIDEESGAELKRFIKAYEGIDHHVRVPAPHSYS